MTWPVVELQDVCEINVGRTPSRNEAEYWNDGVHPWASISDLGRQRDLWNTKEQFSERARQECNMRPVKAGTVLFSFKLSIGKVAIARRDIFTNEAIAALPVKSEKQLYPLFLARALEYIDFSDTGSRAVMGRTLNKKSLSKIEIPLPPLPEQKRIAAILDQADALRRLRARALEKLNTLGQAIFHEMFGDVTLNTMGWPTRSVGEVCTRVSVGVVVKPASYYQNSGVPAIRGTNIKESGINTDDLVYFSANANEGALKKSRVWAGDVVSVRSGRPGLAAVVPPELDGANSIDVLIATPNTDLISPEFLRDFINSPGGRRVVLAESRGQVQQHFNVKSLSTARIIIPPRERIHEYGRRLAALSQNMQGINNSRILMDSLFASLQHRAFRGEL